MINSLTEFYLLKIASDEGYTQKETEELLAAGDRLLTKLKYANQLNSDDKNLPTS